MAHADASDSCRSALPLAPSFFLSSRAVMRSFEQQTPCAYRFDPSVPRFPDDRPIIFFDGHCVLCSRFARFVLRHDKHGIFRLAAAQTPVGQALYRYLGLDPVNFETNILLQDGIAWFKSAGTIRMFAQLGWPWSLLNGLKWIPTQRLDRVYDLIARNRLRWFGSQASCFVMDAAHRDRFLE